MFLITNVLFLQFIINAINTTRDWFSVPYITTSTISEFDFEYHGNADSNVFKVCHTCIIGIWYEQVIQKMKGGANTVKAQGRI